MTRILYRRSFLFYAVILLLVLWAFWPSYYSRPLSQPILMSIILITTLLEELSMSLVGTFVAIGQASLLPADVSALAMSIWDWRSNRRLTVFPVAFIALLAIHVSTMTLYRIPVWKSTIEWFISFPSL